MAEPFFMKFRGVEAVIAEELVEGFRDSPAVPEDSKNWMQAKCLHTSIPGAAEHTVVLWFDPDLHSAACARNFLVFLKAVEMTVRGEMPHLAEFYAQIPHALESVLLAWARGPHRLPVPSVN